MILFVRIWDQKKVIDSILSDTKYDYDEIPGGNYHLYNEQD